jgi:hypothetical protein
MDLIDEKLFDIKHREVLWFNISYIYSGRNSTEF